MNIKRRARDQRVNCKSVLGVRLLLLAGLTALLVQGAPANGKADIESKTAKGRHNQESAKPYTEPDPLSDVPIVPITAAKDETPIPGNATTVWGAALNRGVVQLRKSNPTFKLKYLIARPSDAKRFPGHNMVYFIDVEDYKALFGTTPNTAAPGLGIKKNADMGSTQRNFR